MAGAWDKVVSVENVVPMNSGITFSNNDEFQLLTGTKITHRHNDNTGFKHKSGEDDIKLGESAMGGDVLMALPEGWPKIPQLFVRRSWDFTTATSPAVNKVVAYLGLLQNTLEEWAKGVELEIISQASSHTSSERASSTNVMVLHQVEKQRGSQSSSRGSSAIYHQLKLISSPTPDSVKTTKQGGTPLMIREPSNKLTIAGTGIRADADESLLSSELEPSDISASKITEEVVFEVPYLGAEEVIDEVLTLLARMEDDRRDTYNALQRELERIKMLQARIDNLCILRLSQFGEAVQREHEACSMDINELNWHVSYRTRIESRVKNKVAIAEVLNNRLADDIKFVQTHCPLVQEKLQLEQDAMERIKQAQHDTNDELSVTVDRCAKVENKSEEAHTKADAERVYLQIEVENIRNDLSKINDELSEEKMLYNSYIHQCNESRQQIADNQQELMVLEVKNENANAAEEKQRAKNNALQSKIVEQEFQYKKYNDMNNEYKTNLAKQQKGNFKAKKERVHAIKKKTAYLRSLSMTNGELDIKIADAIAGIDDCNKQRIADEKNLARMKKELSRTSDQLMVAEDDHEAVQAFGSIIFDRLKRTEEDNASEEDIVKEECEFLRQEIKEEIHSRTMCIAQVMADGKELAESQRLSEQKKQKLAKTVSEVETQRNSVKEKVDRLRDAYDARMQVHEALQKEVEFMVTRTLKLNTEHEEAMGRLVPFYENIKTELQVTSEQLKNISWKTEMINKNGADMTSTIAMMQRSVLNNQRAINTLRDQFDYLTVELSSNQYLDTQMETSKAEMNKRLKESEMQHMKMLADRRGSFEQHKIDLEESYRLNTQLAAEYRRLQNLHHKVKSELLNRYGQRLELDSAVKDLKQLQVLQKRMHAALCEYYKLRGMHNTNELDSMESQSSQNSIKVKELNVNMDIAITHISNFLNAQMDGTTARKVAMEKALLEETGSQIDLTVNQQGVTVIHSMQTLAEEPPEAFAGELSEATRVPHIQVTGSSSSSIAV